MVAAPTCLCQQTTVASFFRHPCCNNRFIRQHAARLASSQCGPPRISSSRYFTGTHLQNTTSNGHRCSAFFKFGKSKEEYKGDGEGGGASRDDYSAEDVEYYFNYSGILAEQGSYDSMENLLESGLAPVDILLLMASSEGDAPKVIELLAAGANTSAKGLDGKTALEVAKGPEVKELLQKPEIATA